MANFDDKWITDLTHKWVITPAITPTPAPAPVVATSNLTISSDNPGNCFTTVTSADIGVIPAPYIQSVTGTSISSNSKPITGTSISSKSTNSSKSSNSDDYKPTTYQNYSQKVIHKKIKALEEMTDKQRYEKNGFRRGVDAVFDCLEIDHIIYQNPATIVFWKNGDKTVVKCAEGEEFNKYFGFCAALAKRIYGTNSNVNRIVKSGTDTTEKKVKKAEENKDDEKKTVKVEVKTCKKLPEKAKAKKKGDKR